GVSHVHAGLLTVPGQRNGDCAAWRRELDGIVQQIPDNLLYPARVAIDDDFVGRFTAQFRQQQRDLRRLGLHADRLDYDADRISKANRLAIQFQLARLDTRQIEQIADDLRLIVDGLSYRIQSTGRSGRDAYFRNTREKLGIELNQDQRMTQLVRHDGDELVFQQVGGLGAFEHRFALMRFDMLLGQVSRYLRIAFQRPAVDQGIDDAAAKKA